MSFFDLIRQILRAHPEGMTPQELRDKIKADHPDYYGTESHRRNVERGHYKDLDHALLAQIYVAARSAGQITVDRSQKPIKLTVVPGPVDDGDATEEEIDTEDLEKLEAGVGTMYVLGTNLYTKEGEEILKIGITTGSVDARISQLSTPQAFHSVFVWSRSTRQRTITSLSKLSIGFWSHIGLIDQESSSGKDAFLTSSRSWRYITAFRASHNVGEASGSMQLCLGHDSWHCDQ
jgi:hypothetical protein